MSKRDHEIRDMIERAWEEEERKERKERASCSSTRTICVCLKNIMLVGCRTETLLKVSTAG